MSIVFNRDRLFTPADSQALEERLRAETGLRVETDVRECPSLDRGWIAAFARQKREGREGTSEATFVFTKTGESLASPC